MRRVFRPELAIGRVKKLALTMIYVVTLTQLFWYVGEKLFSQMLTQFACGCVCVCVCYAYDDDDEQKSIAFVPFST